MEQNALKTLHQERKALLIIVIVNTMHHFCVIYGLAIDCTVTSHRCMFFAPFVFSFNQMFDTKNSLVNFTYSLFYNI